VAFIGAIGDHKGYNSLAHSVKYCADAGLPIEFHVIGYTKNDDYFKSFSNVTIHGKYDRKDLPLILAKSNCEIAALLSVWPETYSYTLSEALYAGMKILAYDIGAIAERLPRDVGMVISLDSSTEEIVASLLQLSKYVNSVVSLGKTYPSVSRHYYEFLE
jgi:glycosyltransferase involved in cell wall biosynthesis